MKHCATPIKPGVAERYIDYQQQCTIPLNVVSAIVFREGGTFTKNALVK